MALRRPPEWRRPLQTDSGLYEAMSKLACGPSSSRCTEAAKQTSLGLFIVREITQVHGRRVDVVCEGGQTVSSLTLPRNTDPNQAPG